MTTNETLPLAFDNAADATKAIRTIKLAINESAALRHNIRFGIEQDGETIGNNSWTCWTVIADHAHDWRHSDSKAVYHYVRNGYGRRLGSPISHHAVTRRRQVPDEVRSDAHGSPQDRRQGTRG